MIFSLHFIPSLSDTVSDWGLFVAEEESRDFLRMVFNGSRKLFLTDKVGKDCGETRYFQLEIKEW